MPASNPTDVAGAAALVKSTTVAASGLVVKAAPGNLYGYNAVAGASAGFLMMFDAIAVPADGTVTPARVIPLAANAGVDVTFDEPIRFHVGIAFAFSTTGQFTKTASATAFMSGNYR